MGSQSSAWSAWRRRTGGRRPPTPPWTSVSPPKSTGSGCEPTGCVRGGRVRGAWSRGRLHRGGTARGRGGTSRDRPHPRVGRGPRLRRRRGRRRVSSSTRAATPGSGRRRSRWSARGGRRRREARRLVRAVPRPPGARGPSSRSRRASRETLPRLPRGSTRTHGRRRPGPRGPDFSRRGVHSGGSFRGDSGRSRRASTASGWSSTGSHSASAHTHGVSGDCRRYPRGTLLSFHDSRISGTRRGGR